MKEANAQNQVDRLFSSGPFILGLLGALVATYMALKILSTYDYSGWVGFSSSVIFGIISIYYSVWFWKNSNSTTRFVFGSFALSLICVLCDATIYKFIYNVLHIPHSAISNVLLSSYNIPYTGFLIFQCLGWSVILSTNSVEKGRQRLFLYVPVTIILLACLVLFFFIFDISIVQNWEAEAPLYNFYNLVQALLQIAGFVAAILCLAITKNRGIFYLAVAYLVELTGDVILNFGIFAQSYGMGSFVETFWILGLLLRVYGLANFKREKSFKFSPREWVYKLDDLRSQVVLWIVAIFIVGVYTVSFLVYLNFQTDLAEGRLLQILLSIFIFSLMPVVSGSNLLAKVLCSPMERMESLINAFLSEKLPDESVRGKLHPVLQFRRLESFMLKAFKTQEQKLTKEKQLSEITSVVAHDVRKPFTSLKAMLELLPILKEDEIGKYSEELDLSIRKVDSMLSDIMEYSRDKEYMLTPENILPVLDLSIKDISRYNPKRNVKFYYNFETINLIDLDEQRLSRAFDNIMGNAFEAMPDEGDFIWFSTRRHNDHAEIVIGNSGEHIPEDQVDKIFFNKFTSGKRGGTGLGLSITKKVVEGHKGNVFARNVESTPDFVPENLKDNHGVEFVITLPVTCERGYELRDPVLNNSQEAKTQYGMVDKKNQLARSSEINALVQNLKDRSKKPTILILDDESIYRMRVKSVWDRLSEVKSLTMLCDASSYKEAVELLGDTRVDYLVCDIDLADKKSGFDVLKFTKEKYPDCRVIMHTNRNQSEDIVKAKELGACGFCPKPITEAIFVDLLSDKELWPDKMEAKDQSNAEKKVIFLDDDDAINMSVKLSLKNSPYAAEVFTNVNDALAYYRENEIYAIFSDINLEGDLGGYDFLREVRVKDKALPFVFVSNNSRENEWPKAQKLGATEYIQAPLEKGKLLETLRNLENRI